MLRIPGNYPPSNEIASPTEMRKLYDEAVKEIKSYKKSAQIASAGARMVSKENQELKKETKVAARQVLTLTKKQKATSEAKKAGYWSGAATIGVTILYETWKVVGFPGGHQWLEWWEHEAVYGVMIWLATCTLGWFYRAAHPNS